MKGFTCRVCKKSPFIPNLKARANLQFLEKSTSRLSSTSYDIYICVPYIKNIIHPISRSTGKTDFFCENQCEELEFQIRENFRRQLRVQLASKPEEKILEKMFVFANRPNWKTYCAQFSYLVESAL